MADLAWPIGLSGLGLLIGSFLATLVIRWPQGRSVLGGRSLCDGCGRTLKAWELVPLASALIARGKCGACGTAIDARHWQIELACSAIGLWLGWRMLPFVLLLAALAGLGVVLAAALRGTPMRGTDRLPFGALMAIAAYPLWLVMVAIAP